MPVCIEGLAAAAEPDVVRRHAWCGQQAAAAAATTRLSPAEREVLRRIFDAQAADHAAACGATEAEAKAALRLAGGQAARSSFHMSSLQDRMVELMQQNAAEEMDEMTESVDATKTAMTKGGPIPEGIRSGTPEEQRGWFRKTLSAAWKVIKTPFQALAWVLKYFAGLGMNLMRFISKSTASVRVYTMMTSALIKALCRTVKRRMASGEGPTKEEGYLPWLYRMLMGCLQYVWDYISDTIMPLMQQGIIAFVGLLEKVPYIGGAVAGVIDMLVAMSRVAMQRSFYSSVFRILFMVEPAFGVKAVTFMQAIGSVVRVCVRGEGIPGVSGGRDSAFFTDRLGDGSDEDDEHGPPAGAAKHEATRSSGSRVLAAGSVVYDAAGE
jgi:hypothetical protein